MSFNRRLVMGCVAGGGILTYLYYRMKNQQPTSVETIAKASLLASNNSFIYSPLIKTSIKEITHCKEKNWQQKLKTNLMYAHEALIHTKEVLPEEAINYGENLHGVSLKTIVKVDKMRQSQDWLIEQTISPHYNFDMIYEIIAATAKEYKIGNCGEQTAVSYLYLKREKNLRKVELLCLVGGDHAFVVIGRDPLSDVSNPSTWGKAAVVCDPWGKRYFPADQLFDQLNKLSQRTIYDPKIHSIGWTSLGTRPPEISIYQGLRFYQQKNKKQYAENIITAYSNKEILEYKIINSCLLDYLEKKAKPKVLPLLPESEYLKVEDVWERYLHQNLQLSKSE